MTQLGVVAIVQATLITQPLADASRLGFRTERGTERHIDIHLIRIVVSIEGGQHTVFADTSAHPLVFKAVGSLQCRHDGMQVSRRLCGGVVFPVVTGTVCHVLFEVNQRVIIIAVLHLDIVRVKVIGEM